MADRYQIVLRNTADFIIRHSRENGNPEFIYAENLLDTRWSLPQHDSSRGGYDGWI
jgi:hypothetical protein